jgi:YVTN family beta-propeller protein
VAYDSRTSEVFVSASYSRNVSVISDSNDTVVAEIPVGTYAEGVTYDEGRGEVFVSQLYTSSGLPNDNVSVISDRSDTVVATIQTGFMPRELAYDPFQGEILVTNSVSPGNVSVISDSSDSVIANITAGVEPWGIAYDSATNGFYVANQLSGTVSVLASLQHEVGFDETGLPSNAEWSVVLNGSTQNSSAETVTFSEHDGGYFFIVASPPGYSSAPSSGNLTVSGRAEIILVTFTSTTGMRPGPTFLGFPIVVGYSLLILVLAAVVLSIIAIVIERRRRKARPASQVPSK